MIDLFGNDSEYIYHVNIYADEIQGKVCPYTKNLWNYIGIIIEDLDRPLLKDIIDKRYRENFDKTSEYFEKNNKIVHWSEIRTADTKNICKRWLEYIMNPVESKGKFYSYILGLNDSLLKKEEFDENDEFNSKYNRFFRSAVLYALKTFFNGEKVVVENIFHEVGQQQNNKYFPWNIFIKLGNEKNISFNCQKINFLCKDHNKNERSNLIQLCDVILGISTSIIHGIEKSKATVKYREELLNLYLQLFKDLNENPYDKNNCYEYFNRIIIRFFPKQESDLNDIARLSNQFYFKRELYYLEQKSKQNLLIF